MTTALPKRSSSSSSASLLFRRTTPSDFNLLEFDLSSSSLQSDPQRLLLLETKATDEFCTSSKSKTYLSTRPVEAVLCVFHVSRMLLLGSSRPAGEVGLAFGNCDKALEDVLFGPSPVGDMSLANWADAFAQHPVEVWCRVLRVLCLFGELIPSKTRQTLLWDQGADLKRVVESLPFGRYSALAQLVGVLARDVKSKKQVAWLFGAWVLLSVEERKTKASVERAAQVMSALLSTREFLFAAAGPSSPPLPQRVELLWDSTMQLVLSGLNKADRSFRNLVSRTSEDEEEVDTAKLLEDVRRRPARHRESIERMYGVTPMPPSSPRKQPGLDNNNEGEGDEEEEQGGKKLSSSSAEEELSSSCNNSNSNSNGNNNTESKQDLPASPLPPPLPLPSTFAAARSSYLEKLPQPQPALQPRPKPAFVLKPASSSASLPTTARPLNRTIPPRPVNTPVRVGSPSVNAAVQAGLARRRASSKEAV